jgi:hypothetical protein
MSETEGKKSWWREKSPEFQEVGGEFWRRLETALLWVFCGISSKGHLQAYLLYYPLGKEEFCKCTLLENFSLFRFYIY